MHRVGYYPELLQDAARSTKYEMIMRSFKLLFSARQCNSSHLEQFLHCLEGVFVDRVISRRLWPLIHQDVNPCNCLTVGHIKDNLYSNNSRTEDDLKVLRV